MCKHNLLLPYTQTLFSGSHLRECTRRLELGVGQGEDSYVFVAKTEGMAIVFISWGNHLISRNLSWTLDGIRMVSFCGFPLEFSEEQSEPTCIPFSVILFLNLKTKTGLVTLLSFLQDCRFLPTLGFSLKFEKKQISDNNK